MSFFGGASLMPSKAVTAIKSNDSKLPEINLAKSSSFAMNPIKYAHDIAEAMKTNTSVKKLILSGCSISTNNAKEFAEMLEVNSHLTHLDLSSNKIGTDGVEAILAALKDNETLVELNLLGNSGRIGEQALTALCVSLETNVTLKNVIWRLDSRQAWKITKMLSRNKEIERRLAQGKSVEDIHPKYRANFDRNAAAAEHQKKQDEQRKQAKEEEEKLKKEREEAKQAKARAQQSSSTTTTTTAPTTTATTTTTSEPKQQEAPSLERQLSRAEREIKEAEEAAKKAEEAKKQQQSKASQPSAAPASTTPTPTPTPTPTKTATTTTTTSPSAVAKSQPKQVQSRLRRSGSTASLTSVDRIPSHAIQFLKDNNPQYKKVNLVNNSLMQMKSDEYGVQIAEALAGNTNVTHVVISKANLSVKSAQAIAKAIEKNQTITHLDLSNNRIDSAGVEAICAALKNNKSIVELNLIGQTHRIGEQALTALCNSLDYNITLKKIVWRLDSRQAWKITKMLSRNKEIERRQASGKDYQDFLPDALK